MGNKSEWLTKFYNAQRSTAKVADYISYLADALRVAGNEKLAIDLESCASKLYDAHQLIGDATGEVTNEIFVSARQSTMNMLEAALVVATAKKEEDSNASQE